MRLARPPADRLPVALHLTAVRIAGPHRDLELAAYVLWERSLETLLRRRG